MPITEEDKELYNQINGTVTPGPAVVDPTDIQMFDRINAGDKYEAIVNDQIGVDSNTVEGIDNEAEAMAFAGTMGMLDTYRGVKQYFGIDEQQMRIDQKKLNAIFRNKDYGGKAFTTYMGGIIADPVGWVIPLAKAKSVTQMVKQGVAFGTGLGAASYVDEDSGFSRLEQAGLGAIGGGAISGTLGLAAKRWAGFDPAAITKQEALEKLPSKDLRIEQNRTKSIRRQEAEVSRLTNMDEKLTAIESYKKNVAKPTWDRWVQNPLRPIGSVAGGFATYNVLDAYTEIETAQDFLRNTALTIAGFYAGAKVGNKLNKNAFFNEKMHNLFSENRMNPEILKLADELDGRTGVYYKRITEINSEILKLDEDSQKVAYNLMGGDLGRDELIAMNRGEVVTRQTRVVGDINPATNKKWTKKEIAQLSPQDQIALKNKEMKNERVEDYLDIGLPKDVNKIIKLNDEQTQLMKNIGEDMRLAGIIDDDVFKTNIESYIKRNYDKILSTKGPKAANKLVNNLNKIRGDSIFSRGQKYVSGRKETFTAKELEKIVPGLRAERKFDYRINKTFGKVKDKDGNLINRISDEADPQYNKALTPEQQASNYGVVIRKSKEKPDEYEIITQLTKKERQELGEIESVALSLAKTAQELRSTVGIGKYYAQLHDTGLEKGFVLDSGNYINRILNVNGLRVTNRVGANGKPIISNAETSRIEKEMNLLRTTDKTIPGRYRTGVDESGQPLPPVPYVNLGKYNRLQKQLKLEQDKAYKQYNEITKDLARKYKSATVDNPIPIERVGKDGHTVKEEYVYVPKMEEADPTGVGGKAVIQIGGTKIPLYGKLNGNLIRKDEYKDMMLLKSLRDNDGSQPLGEAYFKLNSFWKKTKTVYNPAVHLNNYTSNYTLYYGAGGKWSELKKVHLDGTAKMILGFERGTVKWKDLPQDLKDMYELGIFGRDMISAELKSVTDIEQLSKAFTTKSSEKTGNFLDDAMTTVTNQLEKTNIFSALKKAGTKVDEKVSGWYQLQDRLFRVALYRSRLNQINPATNTKYSKGDAGRDAIKWFIDYNIKSKTINNLRNTVVPFLSYSYRVPALLAEIGTKNPEKVAVIAALGYAANDMGRSLTGGTKEEQAQERKFMQEFNKTNMFSLGAMPEANIRIAGGEKPKYFNFSRMLPGGDVFEIGGQTPGEIPFAPRMLQPGGPGLNTALNVFGIDPFTMGKRDVEEIGMNAGEVAANRAANIAKDFIPNLPFVPTSFSYKKIKSAYEKEYGDQEKYNTLNDPLTTLEAVANSVGLKINTADVSRLRRFKSSEANAIQSKFKQKVKQLNNERMKGLITLEEYREKVEDIKLELKETIDESRAEE